MTQMDHTGVTFMHMLYNSDSFVVVQIEMLPELGAPDAHGGAMTLTRGGYEIVD